MNMRETLLTHVNNTKMLDEKIMEIEKKINRCKSMKANKRMCNVHAVVIMTSEIELDISNAINLLNTCLKSHKEISKFVLKKRDEGCISDETVVKTNNYAIQLKRYKLRIEEFEFTVENELRFV